MSDLPARIWLTYEIANVHWLAFDEAPTDPYDDARDEYVRADLADAWAKERERLRADLAAAQEREQRMREALVWLNTELDAYWNDHTQAGRRPPEAYIRHITAAQIACAAALGEPQ